LSEHGLFFWCNLSQDKQSFNKMLLLTFARIFGILFSIAIPMYLGRSLTVETYGTYKQIMLFFWLSQVALNFGIDDSAYYHLRKTPKLFPLFSFNALRFNLVAMVIILSGLSFFRVQIASALNNPELASYLPLVGFLLLVTVCSAQYEGILIGLDRFKQRLVVELSMELLKAAAILCGFFFFHSISMVLVFLSTIMTTKLILTWFEINKYKEKYQLEYQDAKKYFKEQLHFGLPLGLGRIVQNLLNMEKFIVSSFFSITQFTFYSVGCFENPLINAVQASMYELVNIELVDATKHGDFKQALEIWRRMNRKLMLVVIPFIIYMCFFATEIITFVFSEKYLSSVPFFIAFNFSVLALAINPEPLFRATSKTRVSLKLRAIFATSGFVLIILAAKFYGPMETLITKVIVLFLMNILGLAIGARFINAHFFQLFRWKQIFGVTSLGLVFSYGLKVLMANYSWHPFWILASSFTLYLLLILISSLLFGIIKNDEKEHLLSLIKKILPSRL